MIQTMKDRDIEIKEADPILFKKSLRLDQNNLKEVIKLLGGDFKEKLEVKNNEKIKVIVDLVNFKKD